MADPNLQIRRGGGDGHPDPEIRGGGLQKHFSALRASVWAKNKGAGPRAPSLDPPLILTIKLSLLYVGQDK